jgi:hypothetical protein
LMIRMYIHATWAPTIWILSWMFTYSTLKFITTMCRLFGFWSPSNFVPFSFLISRYIGHVCIFVGSLLILFIA